MKDKKGFTLIELLAVIVILALLVAIAIPSVTKYITQSKRKTVVTSVDGYVAALGAEVNDGNYSFSTSNTIFAVPIECIELEKGGKNPFGEWMQANDNYWAYVLVQFDNQNFKHTYGFTFKDSGGYGLYPTRIDELKSSGIQINTDYDDLKKPVSGLYSNIAPREKWNGFIIEDDTKLVVLESESQGITGDGKTTCTLAEKGSNYEEVEKEKEERGKNLGILIKENNSVISTPPTLTVTSEATGEKGLYSSSNTNGGNSTYYFRGVVDNNYVSFANQLWRIVRINENGTIRLIMQNGINGNSSYIFNSAYNDFKYMYYSNSDNASSLLENWYVSNLLFFDKYIANGIYCEQAKVKYNGGWTSGKAVMQVYKNYTPDFRCTMDNNEKGIISNKIGLITYDEVIYAGAAGYFNANKSYYLYNGNSFWTMSPAGFNSYARAWYINSGGGLAITSHVSAAFNNIRPVINLNSDVIASGTGTSSDPYVIKIN